MPKSTRLEFAKRIETCRQLIISGVDTDRIVHQVAELWKTGERQARNYVGLARRQIEEVTLEARPYLMAEHIAVRRSIRERARASKDLRAELAAAQDEAKLFGLYPNEKLDITYDWRKDMADAGLDPESLADELFNKVRPKVDADDAGNP